MPRPLWLNRIYLAAPALAAVMLGAVYVQMATAILPLPPRMDALTRLGGWDMLAQGVDEERHAMVGDDGRIGITCEFCSTHYQVEPDEIGLGEAAAGDP